MFQCLFSYSFYCTAKRTAKTKTNVFLQIGAPKKEMFVMFYKVR